MGFHDAFTSNSEKWMKLEIWPEVLRMLRNLHRIVNAYYSRLFKQLNRQVEAHRSDEPVRSSSDAINYKTVERPLSSLTVPSEVRNLNSKLLVSKTYVPIDVNEFMEGLQGMGRYRFMKKVKACLSAPFQLWSWKKGGSSGVFSIA